MKIISLNVNGIRKSFEKGLLDFINKENPDIICFQEIKSKKELPDEIAKIPNYNSYSFLNELKSFSGVTTYTKIKALNIENGFGDERFDNEGRIQTLNFKDFKLVNTYCPSAKGTKEGLSNKLEYFEKLKDFIFSMQEKGEKLIVCGDFNIAHNEIDTSNTNKYMYGFRPEEREILSKILSNGFVDAFRKFNPSLEQYSWIQYKYRKSKENKGLRLDYFFVSDNLENNIEKSYILEEELSDHNPIVLELELD
ncbi:MAG: exodeoxyribonuclease III [Methanobrevibacter sp.]|nr:exodeoxyribonuclease III [Methanobrevibacter sp.]